MSEEKIVSGTPTKVTMKRDEWFQGYATALAGVRRAGHDDATVKHVLVGDGITLADLVAGGAAAFDTDEIARALADGSPTADLARGATKVAAEVPPDEQRRLAWEQKLAAEGRCMSNNDGDCDWSGCPQTRDGEPRKTGRHCPRDLDRLDPEHECRCGDV